MRLGTSVQRLLVLNPGIAARGSVAIGALADGAALCVLPGPEMATGSCPPQAPSSTWEPLAEQYVAPTYWDNPYNWEYITWVDPRGIPTKVPNPDYPQLPHQLVGLPANYSKAGV